MNRAVSLRMEEALTTKPALSAAVPKCYNLSVLDDLLLPLFPLECVLLPEELLPLHIFEERYRQMIGACLEAQERASGQQQFGVVLAKEGEINTVGCSARVVKVVRKYEDGRLDILSRGTRRFEVFLTNEEEPYLRGGVEFFDDDDGADLPNETDAERALELFTQIRNLLGNPTEFPADLPRPYTERYYTASCAVYVKALLRNRNIGCERVVIESGGSHGRRPGTKIQLR